MSRFVIALVAPVLAVAMRSNASVPVIAAARVVTERYADGQVKREATYRAGKLEGTVRGWYENGAPEYVRTYRGGREEGEHRGWFATGTVKFVYHYRRGLSEGLQRQWYGTGAPLTALHHHAGHEAGQQQMWNPDGTIRSNYVIRDGKRYGLIGALGCTGMGTASDGSAP